MVSNKAGAKTKETLSNLKGDYGNIAFLLLLYVLQGIPIGLSSAVPLLLQNRKVSYSEQALFSFVTWPFSLKLLWAPIVDSMYWRRLGRRKSWLIPVQLGIGLFMLVLAQSINSLLTDDPKTGSKPNIQLLTFIFLMLNFLAATQDIVVDGWALTMLKRRNVGYASTCNTAGQTAGYFIGNVIFLALESASFCNKYLRPADEPLPVGVVTFESFLRYCGWVFIMITLIVALLKRESARQMEYKTELYDSDPEVSVRLTRRKSSDVTEPRRATDSNSGDNADEKELSVKETYALLLKIIKLPSLKLFAAVLLTCKIGFSAPDAVSGLKLIEAGVHKENLALLAVPMVPLQIILPWVISRITCGPRPLDLFVKAFPYRLLFGIVFPMIVYWTSLVKLEDGTFPTYYYIVLVLVYALHQVTVYCLFVAIMAFHASVSDPSIGGSYMTLLNTIANLGGNWPSTLALYWVDKLTIKNCVEKCISPEPVQNASLVTAAPPTCNTECTTMFDGYYIECAICVVVGFVWLQWGASRLRRMQSLPPVAWYVSINKSNQ